MFAMPTGKFCALVDDVQQSADAPLILMNDQKRFFSWRRTAFDIGGIPSFPCPLEHYSQQEELNRRSSHDRRFSFCSRTDNVFTLSLSE